MRRLVSIALVCLLVLSGSVGLLNFTSEQAEAQLADSPWPMFRGGPKHTGRSPYDTSHVDGTEKWNYTTGGSVDSSPAVGSSNKIGPIIPNWWVISLIIIVCSIGIFVYRFKIKDKSKSDFGEG